MVTEFIRPPDYVSGFNKYQTVLINLPSCNLYQNHEALSHLGKPSPKALT